MSFLLGFPLALQFLTILPWPVSTRADANVIGRSHAYFPLVGLLLGCVGAALAFVLRPFLPPLVVAGIVLTALIVLSGGIHLDGLIDSCDGLFLPRPVEERLAVMRDSRVGSFGVFGAIALMLLKLSALAALISSQQLVALIIAATLARWAMVYAITAYPYARTSGKGTIFQGHGWRPLAIASFFALATCALWPERGWVLFVAVWASTTIASRFVTSRLGGLTGDSYGALAETAETIALIGASVVWPV